MQHVVMFLRNRIVFLSAALLVSCSLLVLLFFISKQQSVTRKLQTLSANEKFFLEAFFRTLISTDNGSYVLYGNKPTSLMIYKEWQSYDLQPVSAFPSGSDFSPEKKGFEIWQKYQHLFPLKTYTFVKIGSCFSDHMTAVFLIHNKRLFNILRQHFNDFHRIFPHFNSAEYLLNAMLTNPSVLQQICHKHDLLLGIILGFGKDNAALFERKNKIEAFLFPQNFYPHQPHLEKPFLRPIPCSAFATLEEELNAIETKSDGVIEGFDLPGIEWTLHCPLGFLVDKEKTDLSQLRAQLKQHLIKATLAYQKGNFLQVTLNELSK